MIRKRHQIFKKFHKHRVTLPPIKDIELLTDYTFTINLKYPLGNIWNNSNYYRLRLKPLQYFCSSYTLYWDISPNGHLHYHGIIMFSEYDQVLGFYRFFEGEHNYSVEVDTIEDHDKWKEYCHKMKNYKHTVIPDIRKLSYSDIKLKETDE